MRIATIDYGIDTGLGVTEIEETSNEILLRKVYLLTVFFENANEVLKIVDASRCESVVLEKCPMRAAWNEMYIHDEILSGLQNRGFVIGKNPFKPKTLFHITPGIWKPFMQKQEVVLASWEPEFKHERDAMNMLWYSIRINTQKEVRYVS